MPDYLTDVSIEGDDIDLELDRGGAKEGDAYGSVFSTNA